MKSHHKREFRHRKELTEPPFNLNLSDAELWDLAKADILRPYKRIGPSMQYWSTDPLSNDPDYEPLFPGPIAKKCERLRVLQSHIDNDQKVIDKSEDQAWEEHQEIQWKHYYRQNPAPDVLINKDSQKIRDLDFERKLNTEKESFFAYQKTLKERRRQSLEANKKEAADLEKEFEDLPKLYEEYINNMESDSEREYFMKKLEDAYFRRDYIEMVIEARTSKKPAEPSPPPIKKKRKPKYHKEKQAFVKLYEYNKKVNRGRPFKWMIKHRFVPSQSKQW